MRIPNFTCSEAAINFGLSFYQNPEVIKLLECYRENFTDLVNFMIDNRIDEDKIGLIVFHNQLIREAWEACTGKMPMFHLGLGRLNKNILRNISHGGLYW